MAAILLIVALVAAALSAVLVPAAMPLLRRYALARPNVRSSHAVPTPQGAGLPVMLATCVAGLGGLAAAGRGAAEGWAMEGAIVLAAALLLAVLGGIDDLRPLGPVPKLAGQFVAVAAVVCLAAPSDARLLSAIPFAAERALVILGGVWFVNLVNFMDGIDWITVIGCGVPLAALAMIGVAIGEGGAATLLAAALCGALAGFAPYNRPVARVFLGDVGSLPIGLILGYGLYRLALSGHLAAAIVLPLYYLYDTALTLLRRLLRREPLWRAHRSHVYQRATALGRSVPEVLAHVAAMSCVLAGLAAAAVWRPTLGLPLAGAALALVIAVCARLLVAPAAPPGPAV